MTKHINITVDDRLFVKVREWARENDMSISGAYRQGVRQLINKDLVITRKGDEQDDNSDNRK